jgi:Uncharacterised protein family (UPF0236).
MNNIILQNYNDLLKKVIFDIFSANIKHELSKLDASGNVMNYISLLSGLDESLCDIAKKSLITIFETIDKSFSISTERRSKYHIKSHHERTIMTIFGEITFERFFYRSKLTGKLYCYVDRLLGLHKYDYFDPYLKAIIVDYASNNSMPKTALYINNLIGNRIKLEDGFKYLSRQTVRNIILRANISEVALNEQFEIESLYIIADEKWIHTQNNNRCDVMEKSVVIFETITNGRLINKRAFASLDQSFLHKALDYIEASYDVEKIKYIYLMGDGASWIKNLTYEFKFTKGLKVIYGLDKFHFKQALHHLCLHSQLEQILTHYVLKDMKKDFIHCTNLLAKNHSHRSETILEKQKYILNNWHYIINLYKYNLSCPMEAQISHILADLFTSRPKAYSINMINKLTKLRLLFKNKFNIKQLFLHNFNSTEILTFNQNQLYSNKLSSYFNLNNLISNPPHSIPFDNSVRCLKFKTL